MDYDGASKEVVESLVEELTVRKVVINPNTTLLVTYLFYGQPVLNTSQTNTIIEELLLPRHLSRSSNGLRTSSTPRHFRKPTILPEMHAAVIRTLYGHGRRRNTVPNAGSSHAIFCGENDGFCAIFTVHGGTELQISNLVGILLSQSAPLLIIPVCDSTLYYFIPPIANTVAEFMLIHRCYLIWGCKKIIAIPLLVFSVIGSVICLVAGIIVAVGLSHLTFESSQKFIQVAGIVYFAGGMVSICVNVAVTALTAGKIWQINREAQVYMGVEYNTAKLSCAIRIILESGLLYPLMMIIQISFLNGFADRSQFPPIDLYPAVVLSAGIASTLAIVRAQLVKLFEKVNSSSGGVPEIQFNTARLGQLGGMSAISSTISQRTPIRRPSSDELESFKPLISPRHDVGLTLLSEDRAGSAGAPLISPRVDRLQPNR
ncbi:hypothetical protein V5O48_004185 [Marasmius crinis-equi]|uniref:Uncharacterized protein n=1 Tax=Marasmius crinis-equi TaxID=585013 RepID=A0ABR3FR33_9AGAR